jgi:hypothetical protein
MFKTADIEAAMASGVDSRKVRAIEGRLNRIDEAEKPYSERGTVSNEEATELARSATEKQLPVWKELTEYLADYRRWIEWKLTKRWWSDVDRIVLNSGVRRRLRANLRLGNAPSSLCSTRQNSAQRFATFQCCDLCSEPFVVAPGCLELGVGLFELLA